MAAAAAICGDLAVHGVYDGDLVANFFSGYLLPLGAAASVLIAMAYFIVLIICSGEASSTRKSMSDDLQAVNPRAGLFRAILSVYGMESTSSCSRRSPC